MRRRLLLAAIVVVILAAIGAVAVAVPRLPARGNTVPTARVTKSPLKLTVHALGDLRAGRTVTMVAPPVGGMLRIVTLVQTGTTVKAGAPVVEFDPADQQYALEQAKSELEEAEQGIVKIRADAAVQASQDEVALLTARFDVRRGELDIAANEFIGAMEAQKNALSLEEARRRLAQLQEDVKSRTANNDASLAVALEKRNKAQLAMQRAQQVIDGLIIRAPFDGVVSLKENRDASGGMIFWGMILPEYRAGDQIWPGRPVADVIESGRMEVRAKIDEADRPNLVAGQPAVVEVDALPGEKFPARIGQLVRPGESSELLRVGAAPTRLFDVSLQFDHPDPRLKAGVSARVTLDGRELRDAIHVPRQAVFDKAGKNYVFVKVGEHFEQRDVKVEQRTESRVVVSGLAEGTEIALVDPTARTSTAGSPTAPTRARRAEGRGERCASAAQAREHRFSSRLPDGPGEPPRAQVALASDDARDDLRRRRSRRDAVDWCRRAAGSDGVHRATGRAQSDCRSARGARLADTPEDTPALAGLELQGLPRHPGQRRRHCAWRRRESGSPRPSCCRARRRTRRWSTGSALPMSASRILRLVSGRFFDDGETEAAAPVAVLGEAAAASLFGADDPIGRYVKVNEQWFQVIGVAGPQLTVQSEVAGLPAQDRNNLIYVPLYSAIFRLEDGQSQQKDEIDGIYLQMRSGSDVPSAAALLRGLLNVSHRAGRRFHDRLAGGTARRAAPHAARVRDGHGGDRLDLAAGRRHRHHEHHAGERDGADAGNWRAPRDRRQASRCHSSVSDRDDDHLAGRRRDGRHRWRRRCRARSAISPAGPRSSPRHRSCWRSSCR